MTEAEKHVRYGLIGDVGAKLLARLEELSAEHGLCSTEVLQVLVTLLQFQVHNEMEDHFVEHGH